MKNKVLRKVEELSHKERRCVLVTLNLELCCQHAVDLPLLCAGWSHGYSNVLKILSSLWLVIS